MARILVVEDNAANRALVEYLLRAAGHQVTTAADGPSGVEMAAAPGIDLVLMDLHLPGLDGYAATAAIKADPRSAHVPVVAVTALAMVGDRERVLAGGFDGYIAKPIVPETFVADIEAYLRSAPSWPSS